MLIEMLTRANDAARALLWGPPLLALLVGTGAVFYPAHPCVFSCGTAGCGCAKPCCPALAGRDGARAARTQSRPLPPCAPRWQPRRARAISQVSRPRWPSAGRARSSGCGYPQFFGMMTAFCRKTRSACFTASAGRTVAPRGGPMYYLKKRPAQPGARRGVCAVLRARLVRRGQHEPVQLDRRRAGGRVRRAARARPALANRRAARFGAARRAAAYSRA